jgi:hypothetical protein
MSLIQMAIDERDDQDSVPSEVDPNKPPPTINFKDEKYFGFSPFAQEEFEGIAGYFGIEKFPSHRLLI